MATRLSVSFSHGRVAARHDLRLDISDNVNEHMCKYNKHLVYQDVREAFEECFGESLKNYNDKQSRKCRKIENYYDKIVEQEKKAKENKKKNVAHPEYEYVGQIGNRDTNPLLQKVGDKYRFGPYVGKCVEIYKEFLEEFQVKYPNLHVTGFDIHLDEPNGTPHFHLRFVPVAEGYKQGMEKQCSLSKALENLGFERGSRTNMAVSRWRQEQMDLLSEIALKHDIEREIMDNHEKHIENGLYQYHMGRIQPKIDAAQLELDELEEKIESLQNEIEVLKTWPEYDEATNDIFQRIRTFKTEIRELLNMGFFKRLIVQPEKKIYEAMETMVEYVNAKISALRLFERMNNVPPEQQRSRSVREALDLSIKNVKERTADTPIGAKQPKEIIDQER